MLILPGDMGIELPPMDPPKNIPFLITDQLLQFNPCMARQKKNIIPKKKRNDAYQIHNHCTTRS